MTTRFKDSMKRTASDIDQSEAGPSNTQKIAKVWPIFAKQAPALPGAFRWLPSLGDNKTCLHGVNLTPKASQKVAAFDLDGCLILGTTFGRQSKSKAAGPPFQWWRKMVPEKLKEVHDSGYSVVIFTNQALRGGDAIANWKQKIPLIAAALPEVPFRIYAATAKDGYRKPMPGMWRELETVFAAENINIDKEASYFVGDAAGRAGDHAGTDRKFALNLDLKFLTPEEYFLNLQPAPYKLLGFNVSSLVSNLPPILPTSTPLVPPSKTKEIILFVGYPAMGKSSFYKKHFAPEGYRHVNQDILSSRNRCIEAVENALDAGSSAVVDNTNRDVKTRKYYVDLARRHKVPIRCVLFEGSFELAWHNNLYRAYNLPPSKASKETKREALPLMAFTSYRSAYEEPQLSEGFSELKRVNWVFEGTDEERKLWSMWLQTEGK